MSDPSADSSANYVLLNRLADEFAARYRAGERPALKEYIDRYPALAAEILEMFPAMVEIEQVKEDRHEDLAEQTEPVAPALRQLGDYRIIRQVGKGGMGIVYEAEQVSLGRHVALKVLPASMLIDAKAKRRFEREAKSAAKLHHTNIVPVFGVGEQDGMPYYVMQFIQGLGLDEVLEELKKLKLAQAKTGGHSAGELRVSRNVRQDSHPSEELQEEPQVARRELSAATVARSLLTGGFEGTGDFPRPDDATEGLPGSAGASELVASVPRSTAPAQSDSFSPTSSSIVLPARSRDGSKSKNRKQNYWQSVALIGVQVAHALEYAHKQGINHRDIKPSNLLLDTQGTVWVTDFGLAKADDQQNLTHTGDVLGTLRYMPPEAFDGKADVRGDIYSLGLTLYEMLAFRPAFDERERNQLIKQVTLEEPPRLRKLNRQVPGDIETIVHKAIAKDPAERYASAAALAADLQRFIDDEPIEARRVSRAERLRRWCRREPFLAGTMGLAAAALIAATVIATLLAVTQNRLATQESRSNKELRLEQERTQAALRDVDAKLIELRKNSAWAAAERGQSLIDQAEFRRGLLWLVRGLELAPPEQNELQQAIRTSLASFRGEVPVVWASFPHPTPVTAACLSPDGNTVAVAGRSSTGALVRLWEPKTGKPIGQAFEHIGSAFLFALCFSPDSKTILTAGASSVRLWDAASGKALESVALPQQGTVFAACFSPDGKLIATASSAEAVRLFNTTNGRQVAEFRPTGTVYALDFSPDGKRLLASGAGTAGFVHLWDIGTGTDRRFAHARTVYTVAFHPDGKSFATGEGSTARIWDAATGKSVGKTLDHQEWVYAVAYHPDGRTLVTAGGGHSRLWDIETGESRGEAFVQSSTLFARVRFSADGRSILVPGPDRAARLWSVPAGRQTRPPLAQPGEIRGLNCYRDEKSFLVESRGESSAEIRLWEASGEKPIGPALWNRGETDATALDFEGTTVAMTVDSTLGSCPVFRLWDAATGKPKGEPFAPPFRPYCVAAHPSGQRILLAGRHYSRTTPACALQVDARTGKTLFPPIDLAGFVYAAAYSADGNTIVTASRSGASGSDVRLWDAQTGKPIGQAMRHQGSVRSVAISSDLKFILSAGEDRMARLWDAATGKALRMPLAHRGGVNAVAFSPDGAIAATAGSDETARLWHLPTGLPIGSPLRHRGAVYTLAFSQDGATLLTGGADRMIRFWRVPRPLEGAVDHIKSAMEAACGETLGPEGEINALEEADGPARVHRLATPGSDDSQLAGSAEAFDSPPGDSAALHTQEALACIDAANWQAALWHLDRALGARPEDWLCHVLRTEANVRLGNLETAAAAFTRAISLGPGEPVLCWYRAFASRHAALEQWQDACWYLDHMIESRPRLAILYLERARAYIRRNRLNDAAADYAKAVDVGRETPLFWFEKARFDRDRGKWQEAAMAVREGLVLEPHDHYQWYDSSALALFIGDQETYRRICRELLDRFGQSDDPIVAERVLKACVLVPDLGLDQNVVQKLADRVVTGTDKHMSNPFFQLARGIADFRAGRPAQAIERLQRCLEYPSLAGPEHITLTRLFLSMAYEQTGRKDEARRTFEQARARIDAEHENWKREGTAKGNSDWLRSMSVLREAQALIKTP